MAADGTTRPPAILLASASPRRAALMRQAGFAFEAASFEADETPPPGVPPEDAVREIAVRKAKAALASPAADGFDWILAADTVIIDGNTLIGKPGDRTEAEGLLRRFSGRTHRVMTGIALHVRRRGLMATECAVTDVSFASLADDEIRWYLSTGEWEGAAGGYRIQERGACLVASIRGSYSNVMGLPIRTVYGMVRTYGYPACRAGG